MSMPASAARSREAIDGPEAAPGASKRHAGVAPAVRWGRRHAVGMDRSEDRDVVLPKLAFTIKEAERSTGISAATITRAIHTTDPWCG